MLVFPLVNPNIELDEKLLFKWIIYLFSDHISNKTPLRMIIASYFPSCNKNVVFVDNYNLCVFKKVRAL